MSKKITKSVFNKPMREAKKPAKKITVKLIKNSSPPVKEEPIDLSQYRSKWDDGISASINLRFIVNSFKIAHGEQDVSRANLNLFLADLDAAINKVSAVFEP